MLFQHFPASHFSPNTWASGRTTQLFIYPPEAEYVLRNFQFRLSTATVEVEQSDFTPLPGISRELLLLEGSIRISHEGQYAKALNALDSDSFKGDWKTSAEGKCSDFNLMTQGNTQGSLQGLDVKQSDIYEFHHLPNTDWLFVYLHKGKISIPLDSKTHLLEAGGLLVIQSPISSLAIHAEADSRVVFAKVSLG